MASAQLKLTPFQSKVQPLAAGLGIPRAAEHVHTIIGSFAFFLFVHVVLAPAICGKRLKGLGKRARNNWLVHVVSTAHTLLIVPLAWRCLGLSALENDRAFGWDWRVGQAEGVAIGYFIWDTLDATVNFVDVAFVLHGVACFFVYSFAFRPFLAYYAVRCLLWEMSTLFLNIHWILDKTGYTGTTIQLINGIVLVSTFFGVRIVWGGKMSYEFFRTLYDHRHDVPTVYVWVFGLANLTLQSLNWIWFAKMIAALRKRFADVKWSSGSMTADSINGKGSVPSDGHNSFSADRRARKGHVSR